MILVVIGYTIGSTKIVNQGNEALVERLGQYNKKLKPGLNYIIPFIDKIAVEETTREQVLDTEPQQAITKDNISVEVDAIVYWRIKNLEKAYYAVEDVEVALENLVLTTLRSMIGEMELNQTYSSRNDINRSLLHQLAEPTASWGVELVRVEVQNITPPRTVMESLELERAAESQKQAKISEAQGTVESIEIISKALQSQPNSKTVLQYLVTQRYVDANQKLSESPNSKVVFMDPKAITEAMTNLMDIPEAPDGGMVNNSSSSRNQ
jgi:regulator of protease activity HflC (stomatin/prohibitin superfamily)